MVASRTSGLLSLLIHSLIVLVLLSLRSPIATNVQRVITGPIYIPRDIVALIQPSEQGGGGGGDRSPLPASRGEILRMRPVQLAPPEVINRAEDPKLPVVESVLGPEMELPLAKLKWGDPWGQPGPPSNGRGTRGGIGDGDDGGVGREKGRGAGPGKDGFGISDVKVVSGATAPVLIHSVDPEFSEAARRAKFQGVVLIGVIVDATGRVVDPHILQGLGMGLDENALEAVKQWRFKPGMKDGRAVPVYATIHVTFRLL